MWQVSLQLQWQEAAAAATAEATPEATAAATCHSGRAARQNGSRVCVISVSVSRLPSIVFNFVFIQPFSLFFFFFSLVPFLINAFIIIYAQNEVNHTHN